MKPSYREMELPILQMIRDMGGEVPPKEIYEPLADRMGVDREEREERISVTSSHRKWDRAVRWVRQNLIKKGLLDGNARGVWSITKKGERLIEAPEGLSLTVYEVLDLSGAVVGRTVWGCAEAVSEMIQDRSINLCITSPPYPLAQPMEYGNVTEANYVDWFLPIGKQIYDKLTPDGSFVLNLAPVWKQGQPVLSLYIHKLIIALCEDVGFHLAQEHYALNQGKLPTSPWVTVRRERVKNSVENVLWLSKSPYPKADNRNVLEPYSKIYQKQLLSGGYGNYLRPSGHVIDRFNRDNGGKIPHNLLIANSVPTDRYMRYVKENAMPVHPCRFPQSLVEFWVKLTTSIKDMVWDPFCGSNKVGEVCAALERNFVANDRALAYVMGSAGRFSEEQTKWRPEFAAMT